MLILFRFITFCIVLRGDDRTSSVLPVNLVAALLHLLSVTTAVS